MNEYQRLTVFSPAKVNLYLQIVGHLPGGYHSIRTLIAPITLGDTVSVSLLPSPEIQVRVSFSPALRAHIDQGLREGTVCGADLAVLESPDNLAVRAARAYLDAGRISAGCSIEIEKHIPLAGGLGGGSADASGVLRALSQAFPEAVSADDLAAICSALGADVTPMYLQRLAFAHGRGERLLAVEPRQPLQEIGVVLLKPTVGLSAAQVYAQARHPECRAEDNPHEDRLLIELLARIGLVLGNQVRLTSKRGEDNSDKLSEQLDFTAFCRLLRNDLGSGAVDLSPEVAMALKLLAEAGTPAQLVSGSGSTTVGYCRTAAEAELVRSRLRVPAGWFTAVAQLAP